MSDISPAQLRAARALVGVSQEVVAKALHISTDTIWRVEVERGTERTKAQLAEYWQRQGGVEFAPGGWVRLATDGGGDRTGAGNLRCVACDGPMPDIRRSSRRYCSDRCRQRAYRERAGA
jgi:DNA-binding XRE family transcriptional regulator